MANRRMFSKDITSSDAFLDMPTSTQALYFQLGMHADDDGFLGSAKRIARMLGCGEDDFKILVAKRFVLVFDDGICVIKHWRMNNQIRKDRYKKTVHTEKLAILKVNDNGSYKSLATNGLPNGNQMATQYSIVEDSIVEDSKDIVARKEELLEELQRFYTKRNKKKNIKDRKGFKQCKGITKGIEQEYTRLRKKYSVEDFEKAVISYMEDIAERSEKDSYANHRFSLYEFLKQRNGFERFYNI